MDWFDIALALIGVGLVWRLVPLGLNGFAIQYGGSVLWAAVVYYFCAVLFVYRSTAATGTGAGFIALITELLRLYHGSVGASIATTL